MGELNLTKPQAKANGIAIVVFDIDGVVRDVSGSYRRAIADTVEHFTGSLYRPSEIDIDQLKSEGIWNNDWEATQELIYRYFETQGQARTQVHLNGDNLINFFQSRYRGPNSEHWTGYICTEVLLMSPSYLENLTAVGISWGFFSGAPRDEAQYALLKRLGLDNPVLVAMEDAPGKPDPTGLLTTVKQLEHQHQLAVNIPVIYVGDTVADIYTLQNARTIQPERHWIAVGVLPPHVQDKLEQCEAYENKLIEAGAALVFNKVEQLTFEQIQQLVQERRR